MSATKVQNNFITDGSVTAAKLSTGHPTWDASGNTVISGIITASSFKASTPSSGFLKADGSVDTNTYVTQTVPTGAVFHFAASTAPTGYLKANGDTVPNGTGVVQGITANFSALYAILGSTYGAAGKLPDLRGEFIRGWDDSRGADTGRTFGSFQDWAIENIKGSVITETRLIGDGKLFTTSATADGGYNGPGINDTNFTFDASKVVKTSTETRPRNVALLACIKY